MSITKLFMWAMLASVIYVLVYQCDNLAMVIAASGGQLVATANYMYKRYVLNKTGQVINDIPKYASSTSSGVSGSGGYQSRKADPDLA